MLKVGEILKRGPRLRVVWDLFMVLVAVVNLLLIAFDWTYFIARPYYRLYMPALTRVYDPVKGIVPHRVTGRYLDVSERWLDYLATRGPGPVEVEPFRSELLRLAAKMEGENPFDGAGLSGRYFALEDALAERLVRDGQLQSDQMPGFQALTERFYFGFDPDNDAALRGRRATQADLLRPLLLVNFEREVDRYGRFVDWYFLLDGPFLTLFLIEFLVRWVIAVRRRTVLRWFLFPLYNWYDVLGLLPLTEFRFFRLFRIASIYMRLHRSEFTNVGDDIISRTIKRYRDIITEEISDLVAIRILKEMQDEVRSGTSVDIFVSALEPRREEIKRLVAESVARFAAGQPGRPQMERMLSRSLEDAARRVPSLTVVPGFIKERLTREIGVAVYQAISDTLAQNLQGDRGRETIDDVVDFLLDDMIERGRESEINVLFQDVTVAVLENMKKTVAVKKWALDDRRATAHDD